MAKSNLLEKLETYVIVTVIAALIWLHAEEKSVAPYSEPIQVQFVASARQKLAIDPREPQTIRINFEASKASLQRFKDLTKVPLLLEVGPPPPDQPYNQPRILKDLLAKSKLGQIGLSIEKIEPETLLVEIQPIVTVEMKIAAEYGDVEMDQPPTVDPLTASVKLPQLLAKRASGRDIIALLDRDDLLSRDVGVLQRAEVVLRLPSDLESASASITPPTAQVEFTISKKTDSYTVASVPIKLNVTVVVNRQWYINLNDEDLFVSDPVELSGPSDIIEQIRQGHIKIIAQIRPTAQELENNMDSALVEIQVPPGVTVVSPAAPTVPIIVRPRAQTP